MRETEDDPWGRSRAGGYDGRAIRLNGSPASPLREPTESPTSAERAEAERFSWFGLALWVALAGLAYVNPRARLLLIVLALGAALQIAHLGAFVLVGLWRGARIQAVGIGFGGWLLRARLGSVWLRLNWGMAGGYVKFFGHDDDDLPPPRMALSEGPPGSIHRLRPWERIVLQLSGPLAVLLVAVVLLGPEGAWASFVSGFRQYVAGALSPLGVARDLWARFFAIVASGALATAAGLMAAKSAAVCLFPLTANNGGLALIELFEWARGKPLRGGPATAVQLVGMLLLIASGIAWATGLVNYLWRG